MNVSNGTNSDYLNLVQKATRRNTVTQLVDAKQSGKSVDVEQLQASNQQIRDAARETGVELYTQKLQKQTLETYANTAQNTPTYTTGSSDSSSNDSSVYTFDAAAVNDGLQTVQKRAVGVALYENLSNRERPGDGLPNLPGGSPVTSPVNVYV